MKRLLSILMTIVLTLTLSVTASHAADENFSIDKCKITFSKKSYTYTGNGITPIPTVKYKKKKLKKDKDYNIYYKDNINVGTATVTLIGLGKYKGTTTATFSIVKGKQKINAKSINATYGDDPIDIAAIATNPLSYKSSNKKVAKVSPVGTVTIIGAGKAKITIKAEESSNVASAKKTITVTIKKSKTDITAFGELVKTGKKLDLHAESSSGAKLKFISSDKHIAKVSSKGIVKGLKSGHVTITIKSPATKNYKAGVKKMKIEVSDDM